MSNNEKTITFHPNGYVKNQFKESIPGEQMGVGEHRIILDLNLMEGLRGMEPGQQVMVLFYFDRIDDFDLLQHPRGDLTFPEHGILTIRSPRRLHLIKNS